jgi:hypothetical protein
MRLAIFTSNIKKNGGVVVSSVDDGVDFFLATKEVEQKPALMLKVQDLWEKCAGEKSAMSLTWMEDMLTKRYKKFVWRSLCRACPPLGFLSWVDSYNLACGLRLPPRREWIDAVDEEHYALVLPAQASRDVEHEEKGTAAKCSCADIIGTLQLIWPTRVCDGGAAVHSHPATCHLPHSPCAHCTLARCRCCIHICTMHT